MKRSIIITLALILCASSASPGWARGLGVLGLGGGGAAAPVGIAYESVAGDYVTSDEDTTLVVPKPAGTTDGDTLVAISSSKDSAITPPSGWSAEMSLTLGLTVFSKVAGSAEPSEYTFTTSTYKNANICIVRVSGAISDISVSSVLETADYNTAVNFPGAVVDSSGAVVLWAGTRKTSGVNLPVMSTITTGTLIYNSGSIATATSLWVAAEEDPSQGNPITGAVGTLSGAINSKAAISVVIK